MGKLYAFSWLIMIYILYVRTLTRYVYNKPNDEPNILMPGHSEVPCVLPHMVLHPYTCLSYLRTTGRALGLFNFFHFHLHHPFPRTKKVVLLIKKYNSIEHFGKLMRNMVRTYRVIVLTLIKPSGVLLEREMVHAYDYCITYVYKDSNV